MSAIREFQAINRAIAEVAAVSPGVRGMAFDSVQGVYAEGCRALGYDLRGVHASAWPEIFRARLRQHRNGAAVPRMAMDSASAKAFADRFPDAARITVL